VSQNRFLNYGLTRTEIAQIDAYVAALTDPDREPDSQLSLPPTDEIGWLLFWTQVNVLKATTPVVFWVVCLCVFVVLPCQLIALLALQFTR
jgi:hypothetical protein